MLRSRPSSSPNRSLSPLSPASTYSSIYGRNAYGRVRSAPKPKPEPKPKPPPISELEEKNSRIREECNFMRKKIADFNDKETQLKVKIAQLSGDSGAKTQKAERLEQETDEIEHNELDEQQRALEVEVVSLREERSAWEHRIQQFASASINASNELEILEEEVERGGPELRQMQVEVSKLQKECEDARVALQETRDLIRETRNALDQMAKQKLELEWELQEKQSQNKIFQTAMHQAENQKAGQAEEVRRRRVEYITSVQRDIEHQRVAAESFRCLAVGGEREIDAIAEEQKRLEQDSAKYVPELQRLEDAKRGFEEDLLKEHSRQNAAKEILDKARRRREALLRELAELEGHTQASTTEIVEMQEERARHLLEQARRQASEVLERAPAVPADFQTAFRTITLPTSHAGSPLKGKQQ